jgi:hypothetical protein
LALGTFNILVNLVEWFLVEKKRVKRNRESILSRAMTSSSSRATVPQAT